MENDWKNQERPSPSRLPLRCAAAVTPSLWDDPEDQLL